MEYFLMSALFLPRPTLKNKYCKFVANIFNESTVITWLKTGGKKEWKLPWTSINRHSWFIILISFSLYWFTIQIEGWPLTWWMAVFVRFEWFPLLLMFDCIPKLTSSRSSPDLPPLGVIWRPRNICTHRRSPHMHTHTNVNSCTHTHSYQHSHSLHTRTVCFLLWAGFSLSSAYGSKWDECAQITCAHGHTHTHTHTHTHRQSWWAG